MEVWEEPTAEERSLDILEMMTAPLDEDNVMPYGARGEAGKRKLLRELGHFHSDGRPYRLDEWFRFLLQTHNINWVSDLVLVCT